MRRRRDGEWEVGRRYELLGRKEGEELGGSEARRITGENGGEDLMSGDWRGEALKSREATRIAGKKGGEGILNRLRVGEWGVRR